MPGRPFLQIPGPTLVPERIVRAMSESIIDHRGPKFAALVHECLEGLKGVFQTEKGQIVIYPGSGTGAWEACLVNTLSPGDRVLDRKSTRLNSSHIQKSRMPSSA